MERVLAEIGPLDDATLARFRYLPEFQCLLYRRGGDVQVAGAERPHHNLLRPRVAGNESRNGEHRRQPQAQPPSTYPGRAAHPPPQV